MRKLLFLVLLAGVEPAWAGHTPPAPTPGSPAGPEAVPHARPGECFARVTVPARVETYEAREIVEEEREVRREIPARYEDRTRDVVVRPEQRRTVTTEPVYAKTTETVLVRPGEERRVVEPARTRVVYERVAVAPPTLAWTFVRSPHQPGGVWCLVEAPARTAMVTRTEEVRPETVRTTVIPPVYKTVPRTLLVRPSETREVVESAVIERVTVRELVEPGRVEVSRTAPRYAPVVRTRTVEDERRAWVRVLCETEADAETIRALQAALARRGHYRGPVDGLYGPATARAVSGFQLDAGVPHEGYLSHDTLAALEVERPRPAPKKPRPAPPPPRADRN